MNESKSEYQRRYYQAHKEEILATKKAYYDSHKEEKRTYGKDWGAKQRATNPKYRINATISGGMRRSLKARKNGRAWESLVDYTLSDLMAHLRSLFEPGMTFENHGRWHIDHKVPISVFNFEQPDDIDFGRCWALSNLQPMWAIENLRKSDRVDRPFQPSLAIG